MATERAGYVLYRALVLVGVLRDGKLLKFTSSDYAVCENGKPGMKVVLLCRGS